MMRGFKFSLIRRKHLAAIALAACLIRLISGCGGNSQPNAHGLTISLDPNKEVLMGPGPDSSCTDLASYKIGLENGTTATSPIIGTSVAGPVIMFNNFTLNWNSRDTLFVQGIIVDLTGSGIAGGSTQIKISQTEIEALLANPTAVINPPVTPPPSTPLPVPTPISSTDPARNATGGTALSLYAPCGLAVGPVPLANGEKTSSFQATVQVTVIGTGQDSDGNQYFVEYQATATARYFAIP
jgi:hypothetical protein